MSKQLDAIDAILKKPIAEWSEEELEAVTEWRVQKRLNEEEYNMKVAAMQEELTEAAEYAAIECDAAIATLGELKNKALELFERASL